ncbi:hypothetical protein M422DRAFT_243522 [Sphaerobolus stellatus SS14]|nr:hypothetical protein M422DRAFT_243522 [Sphaerobolus stellatus SS14]
MSENAAKAATKQLLLFLRMPVIVNFLYNLPIWPIKRGSGKCPAAKKPSFTQLATSLLNPEVRMKTTLPVPSEALQIEAAQILATLGIDGLKPTPTLVNKSKTASARTLSGQKDALVAKVQAEGMVKPSALASELRVLNIDTRVSEMARTPTPATGMSTLAITSTIPPLSHANEILDNHTQYHTNPAEQRAPEGTESGGLSGVAMGEH